MAYDPRVVAAFNKAVAHTQAPDVVRQALFESGLAHAFKDPPQDWASAFAPYHAAVAFSTAAAPLATAGLSSTDIVRAIGEGELPSYVREEDAA